MIDTTQLKKLMETASEGRWKVDICHTGEECWCRIISTEGATDDDRGVAHAGDLSKADAELIVEMRNSLPELIRVYERYWKELYDTDIDV